MTKVVHYCADCGNPIDIKGRSERCKSCAMKLVWADGKEPPVKKWRKYLCLDCGVEISRQATRCRSCCRKRIKNPNWRGGIALLPYLLEFDRALKRRIFERDNFTCQLCGTNRRLTAHHVDYDKTNNRDDNLLTLCRTCNSRVNFNRDYWRDYFVNKSRACKKRAV